MDKPRKAIDIPWPAIATALIAVGGFFVYLNPLQTSRPAEGSGFHLNFNHPPDVDARLWQDPLRTTAEYENKLQEQKHAGTDISFEDSLHCLDRLRSLLGSSDYWLLAIMIPGGSYAEYSEARLRTRQAVLEGLGAENYVPVDGEHIGYVKITSEDGTWHNTIIPVEWCNRSGAHHLSAQHLPNRVCLVWLPEEEFREAPLHRLNWLLCDPTAFGLNTSKVTTRIIGPPTSTTLLAMMRELAKDEKWRGLPQVKMWCATATASDEVLLHDVHGGETYQTIEQYFTKKIGRFGPGKPFVFRRCTASDRDVIHVVARELKAKRGLTLTGKDNDDHVALISEWDTFYGRALPVTFEREVSTMPLDQLLKGDHPNNILIYHYLRGIDGMLPGASIADASKTEDKTKTDEKKTQSSVAREMTEGLNQSDYLRRLARALIEQNETFRRQGQSEIKAVGVLGSDVYDKLLVMEALRDALPNAIFFTTPLDARLVHPDEWRWTRNLLVSSPFGFSLREDYQDVPPFRDSNQVACYTAALLAAENPALEEFLASKDVLRPVRLYEVSRKGAFDLTPPLHGCLGAKTLQPANSDMERWWSWRRGVFTLILGLCAIAAISWSACAILGQPNPETKSGPADRVLGRMFASPWSMFLILGFCSLVSVWVISCYHGVKSEPYSWNDGISVWPTETLRLLASLLGVFYICKISSALWLSEKQVETHFALPAYHQSAEKLPPRRYWVRRALVRAKALWRKLRRIKPFDEHWRSRVIGQVIVRWDCGDEGNPIDAAQLWKYYCASGTQSARWLRIGPLVVLFIAAAYFLLFLLGFPAVPARGKWAQTWDRIFLQFAILSSVSLTFYVADVMLLSRRFIHYLMKNVTIWPPAAVDNLRERWSRSEPVVITNTEPQIISLRGNIPPNELLREYLDIDFIAYGTDFIGRQIYYPFIVISLLIISRLGVFDHWTWPIGLLIIMCFNAGYVAFSFIYLRRTAEKARQRSLKRLHDMLMAYTATGEGEGKEAKTIREATMLIQNEDRGAFASFSQQPLAAALLLPSGSAGIWALLQSFPRLFSG